MSHGATVPSGVHLEVGERALDAGLGPVGVGPTEPLLERGDRGPLECGRRERPARSPTPAAGPEIDRSAVDADDAPDQLGIAPRQLDGDVSSPRLADGDGAVPSLVLDEHRQVVGQRGEVVAVVGLGAQAVTPEVDAGHRVPELAQPVGDAVPRARVRRQAVHEQERHRGGVTFDRAHV